MREKTGVDDGIRTRSKSFTDSGANRYTTSTITWYDCQGSNLDHKLRRLIFYPLNYSRIKITGYLFNTAMKPLLYR